MKARKKNAVPKLDRRQQELDAAMANAARAEQRHLKAIEHVKKWLMRSDGHVIGCWQFHRKPSDKCPPHCREIRSFTNEKKKKRRTTKRIMGMKAREVAA